MQRNLENYFLLGKYLLGNFAYLNIFYMITSYKSLFAFELKNCRFNWKFLKIGIDIEYVFGILKSQ